MKTLITFNFVLLMVLNAFSKRAPEAFLARIPALPAAACDMPTKEKEKYLNKVIELSEQIKEKISEMKQERQDFADNNVEKMQKNMAKQMGLPPGDMAKMNKGGQPSEAEAMAMADKMMKEKYNMSLGEAKNLEKMGRTVVLIARPLLFPSLNSLMMLIKKILTPTIVLIIPSLKFH